MNKKVKNQNLHKAQTARQDEFYTQLSDISQEVKHYKEQLRGKTILCNCDDPYESNFFKHFALNFNALGLRTLIATSHTKSPIAGTGLSLFTLEGLKPEGREPYAIEINAVSDLNADGAVDLLDVEYLLQHDANSTRPLKSDGVYVAGDFRSRDCVELLKQSDIVITNPPFSLFREYVAQLVEHEKQFLIIGNKNAITYKEVFTLIQENRIRTGYRGINSDMWFEVPEGAAYEKIENGKKVKHIMATWLTNLEVKKHSETIPLFKKYSAAEYPTYCNYDAIEVGKVADIPVDYLGKMGVPITFLDKYNPEQFEIIGSSRALGRPMSEVAPKGSYEQGGVRFYLDNGDGTYNRLYDRIVIRKKAP